MSVSEPTLTTVLLIDDDPQWCTLVQHLLPRAWPGPPLALLVAATLEAGVAALTETLDGAPGRAPVDLVLLDLALPGCTDLVAVRALVRAMQAGAGLKPVVVLSGYLTAGLRRQALVVGGQECVSKNEPEVFARLAEAIERAWARHCFQRAEAARE